MGVDMFREEAEWLSRGPWERRPSHVGGRPWEVGVVSCWSPGAGGGAAVAGGGIRICLLL